MATDSNQDIARRMREKRMAWVELAEALPGIEGVPGSGKAARRLRLIRPSEEQLGQGIVIAGTISIGYDEVKRFVVDWSGFTQADLLGSAIGTSDPVAFAPDLWAEYVTDNTDAYRLVAQKLLDLCLQHVEQRAQDRKN